MSKYTKEQLQEMAKTVLHARDSGDDKYIQFVLTVAGATGVDANEVVRRIERMARGEDVK